MKVRIRNCAFRGCLQSYELFSSKKKNRDPAYFICRSMRMLHQIIDSWLDVRSGLKIQVSLVIQFNKMDGNETTHYFNTEQLSVLRGTNVLSMLVDAFAAIMMKVDDFQQMGSGWFMIRVCRMDVHIAQYQPLKAKSYIKLPQYIRNKHAVINVKNRDNKCFIWAILSALHPVPYNQNASRIRHYLKYMDELPWQDFEMPMKITDINKFESRTHLSISLYEYKDQVLIPLYLSKQSFSVRINLLIYREHYCWIKNLDGLLRDQNKHDGNHFCPSCLHAFATKEKQSEHFVRCQAGQHTLEKMPVLGENTLEFRNTHRQLEAPMVIYADFECLTEKICGNAENTDSSYTRNYQKHTPCGFGLMPVKRSHGKLEYADVVIYRGKDSMDVFFDQIIKQAEKHLQDMNRSIIMTRQDWKAFDQAKLCHVCSEVLGQDRVRDHCHISGGFRGAAHKKCNLALRLNKDVTIAMHNLRRYDGHIIMAHFGKLCEKRRDLEIKAVAKNMEDYLSFSLTTKTTKRLIDGQSATTVCRIRFIDTCQFLQNSLETLVTNLESTDFRAMQHDFTEKQIDHLRRKQVYPYDYMSSWDKLEDNQLPQKDDFYNILTQSQISQSDYDHAHTIWKTFHLKTLGEYHDLYLKTDVLLLADVFEKFRSFSMQYYGLDPVHYITLPAFGLDAMLKLTRAQAELITDPTMYSFFEAGIRGGISVISHRYARANNKYLSDYDPSQPSSYLIYLDVNNLYGKAMTENLPYSKFEWMNQMEIETIDFSSVADKSEVGYVLEVDLEYPVELHEKHNSFPLAAERIIIHDEMLSAYAKEKKSFCANVPKLIPNLMDKRNYIIHYRNLKVYMKYGLKLTRVHRGVKFCQKPWMKPYIKFNTKMRQDAENCSDKDFFKLLNNAVFGKTMENVRNYRDVKLVLKKEKFLKLVASPRYLESSVFANDLVAVHMARHTVTLNKPIYTGFSILDLSKTYMAEFHHGYLLPKYGVDNVKVCMSDTDSFINFVQTDDIYKDMLNNNDRFDFSNYPKNHLMYSSKNQQKLGKMKDETGGVPIKEFVGLRSKMYSVLCEDNEEKKRAKGVRKTTLRNQIQHSDYVDTLTYGTTSRHVMHSIRSTKHQIFSIEQNKVSLCAFDDKRFLLDDGITSMAYGHFKISKKETE